MCIDFMPNMATDGTIVSARTIEFGTDLQLTGLVRARGCSFESPTPDNANGGGLKWKNRYGYIGASPEPSAFGVDYITHLPCGKFMMDGMNEAGLSCGGLWLPQTRFPETIAAGQQSKALHFIYFMEWVLGCCTTVAEVKNALENKAILVWADPGSNASVFVHMVIYDKTGVGAVIEFVDGVCHCHDNPYLVCTNGPTFDWQITNVMNYVNMTNATPSPLQIKIPGTSESGRASKTVTYSVPSTGHGAGMLGLPGDYTPPSRLIRTLMLKNSADQASSDTELVTQTLHLLNNTDITLGTSIGDVATDEDYTQVTVIRDFTENCYYFRSHDNLQLRRVDLTNTLKQQADGTTRGFQMIGYSDHYIAMNAFTDAGNVPTLAHAAQ